MSQAVPERKLSFTYSGHSANWDAYTCSDPNWSASALWRDYRFEPGPDGERVMVRVKPATYTVTVQRLGTTKWVDVARFQYTPSRNPKDMHIPNRTITRLIRQHLNDGGPT